MAHVGAIDGSLIALEAVLALLTGLAAWRLGTVTGPGSLFMGLIGLTILLFGGWSWLVPILIFFVSVAVIERIPNGDEFAPEARTAGQVLANGAVAWVGVLLFPLAYFSAWQMEDSLAIYIGAIAAANADTWATEIGTRFGGSPHDMVSGRALPVGTSGGITGIGTVGAALGALAVAGLLPWLDRALGGSWKPVVYVTLAGWLGAMTDSFLGSVAQHRYRCRRCGHDTESAEHCGTATAHRRGVLTGNQVNWICTLIGGITSWAWLRW